jgi:hypothetical protein
VAAVGVGTTAARDDHVHALPTNLAPGGISGQFLKSGGSSAAPSWTSLAIMFKTINSENIVGDGNIALQPTLVSGTNIKTINSTSLLGSGNIITGNVNTASNNIFTGANRFDNTVEFNSGMIDLNQTQGISGQFWKSSGAGVPPQWTSLDVMFKKANGVNIVGDGNFVVYRGGTGIIANGAYNTTITFSSMGFTPTLEHISITLGGAADYHARVESITSTSFVVGTNQNIGAKAFGWRILRFNP